MENAVSYSSESRLSLSQLIRSLGPGIMMAAAAVGGSHLVASTKKRRILVTKNIETEHEAKLNAAIRCETLRKPGQLKVNERN